MISIKIRGIMRSKKRLPQILPSLLLASVSGYYSLLFYKATPLLYRFIFSIIKQNLEEKALPAELPIYVYNFAEDIFLLTLTTICSFGVLCLLYQFIQSSRKTVFLQNLIFHASIQNIKITLFTNITYLVPLMIVGRFYVDKLWLLAQKPQYTTVGYNPFKLVLHVAQKMNLFGKVVGSLKKLHQAKLLYAHINDMSAFFYLLALGIALFSTIWFFYSLLKKMR